MYVSVVPFHRSAVPKPSENIYPFMNNMDEITYWIYTKRAPCLMNYDNLLKKQTEVAHCSQAISVPNGVQETPSLKKKKKRKLSMSDEDTVSTEKPLHVFQTTQNQKKHVLSESDSESDLIFNIKKSTVKQKAKHPKLLKSRTLQKKNKVITSTPKAVSTTLRRSLRQAKLNNTRFDSSCVVFQADIKNGSYQDNMDKIVNSTNNNCHEGDETPNCKRVVNEKLKNLINGQFEDLSDVSGFTANYIRSTKAQANKNPGKLNSKETKNLVKESKNSHKDNSMLICTNKGINTGLINTSVLNSSSTDSDKHIINLISMKNNEKAAKVNRGTSMLKFRDSKNKTKDSGCKKNNKKLSISFQSNQSAPRYPKRHKITTHTSNLDNNTTNVTSDFNVSDHKENPEEKMSRTRSGRNIGLALRQPQNSVLVLSNSTEQVSSMVSMNVATPEKKKKRITRQLRTRHCEKRDSAKERTGYSACFSDSDDSEPLQRKIFCG